MAENAPKPQGAANKDGYQGWGCILIVVVIIFSIMYFTSNPNGTPRGGGTWTALHAPRVRGVCTGSPSCQVCSSCSTCAFCGRGRFCGRCANR